MTVVTIVIVGSLFSGMFTLMYFDMREQEKRELLQENDRLQNEIANLKDQNRILRGRLGEQPGRAEY